MCEPDDLTAVTGDPPSNSAYAYYKNVLKSPEYILAPMVEQSELPWRMMARAHGADLCFTPMLHANVFARDNRYRCEHLTAVADDRPLIAQFAANAVEPFVNSIRLIAPFVDGVDLNLGCPQMIAKKGNYGAFLQDDWKTIAQLISAAHTLCPETPISAKIRVFDDDKRTVEYAKMLEGNGLQMLTVHGRTRDMRGVKTGVADWTRVALVKRSVDIPVIANGNIQLHDDLQRCLRATKCDGVMSAEGQLHNPYIFETAEHATHWSAAVEYMHLCRTYPTSVATIRGHLFKLFHHSLCVFGDLRAALAHAASVDDMRRVVTEMQRRCMPLHATYLLAPKSIDTAGLMQPHWLCQPYYRPSTVTELRDRQRQHKVEAADPDDEESAIPTSSRAMYEKGGVVDAPPIRTIDKFTAPMGNLDRQIAAKLDARKRRTEALDALSQASGLSRKLVRKLERQVKDSSVSRSDDFRALSDAARKRQENKPNKFAICSCLSPLSPKCDHSLCKKCCKQDCIENAANCTSHQHWYGDKSGLRAQMEHRHRAKAVNKTTT